MYIDFLYQKDDDVMIELPEGYEVGSISTPIGKMDHRLFFECGGRQEHLAPDAKGFTSNFLLLNRLILQMC